MREKKRQNHEFDCFSVFKDSLLKFYLFRSSSSSNLYIVFILLLMLLFVLSVFLYNAIISICVTKS